MSVSEVVEDDECVCWGSQREVCVRCEVVRSVRGGMWVMVE